MKLFFVVHDNGISVRTFTNYNISLSRLVSTLSVRGALYIREQTVPAMMWVLAEHKRLLALHD